MADNSLERCPVQGDTKTHELPDLIIVHPSSTKGFSEANHTQVLVIMSLDKLWDKYTM